MTEQAKHTAGPIEIVEAKTLDNSGQWHIYLAAPDGRKIAALWGTMEEKLGNAALYSAAPDLYAIATHPVLEHLIAESDHPSVKAIFEPMRLAALSKAGGANG